MFNNRFNSTHKDPLVEAVRQAQQDGDLRRQAEAFVNEEFGVYSRQAVVRENLAAYDARIEEAYKCMKEGKPLSPKQQKMASLAGDPKKIDAADLASLRKGAKIDEKKGCYEEGMDSDVVGGSAVTKDSKPVVSSTASKVDTSGPSASDKAGLAAKIGAMKEAKLYELKAPTGKTARQVMDRAERRDDEEGNWSRSNRIYKSMKKRYPGKSARNQKDTGKADLPDVGNIEFHKAGYSGHVTKGGKLTKAASRDTKDGIKSRLGKHTKPHLPEETIEEAVSRKHFQQVADLIKGHESQEKRNELASHHAGIFAKQNPRFDHGRFHKAAGSTAHEAPKKMEEARAGKDIGKPGKMFAQIAAKAGEKYGSEERGKKVAGAILKKIRAKQVKEENLEELSQFGSAFAAARKAGQSTFNMGGKSYTTQMKGQSSTPTPPSRPAGVGADKPVGDTGYKSGQTVSLKPIVEPGTAQAATPSTPAPRSAPIPGQKSPAPVNQADTINKSGGVAPIAPPKVAPTPPSRPASLGGSSAPAKPMQNPDQNITKVMKEEVQVGNYKYKII